LVQLVYWSVGLALRIHNYNGRRELTFGEQACLPQAGSNLRQRLLRLPFWEAFFSLYFFDYGFCFRAKPSNIYQKSNNYEFDPSIS
jgi:hypothetical protein